MSDENLRPEGQPKKNTRRKILKTASGVGTSSLVLSGTATADKKPKKDTEDITKKDPEEVFDGDVTEMTNEELDELVEEKWDEGKGHEIVPASVDENCIAEELDLDNIPLIDVNVCLVDEPCGVEVTLGALGQSTTMVFDNCNTLCQTYELNAVAEILEVEVCNRVPFSVISISVEHCNWRPTRGWDCPNSGKRTIDLPW